MAVVAWRPGADSAGGPGPAPPGDRLADGMAARARGRLRQGPVGAVDGDEAASAGHLAVAKEALGFGGEMAGNGKPAALCVAVQDRGQDSGDASGVRAVGVAKAAQDEALGKQAYARRR